MTKYFVLRNGNIIATIAAEAYHKAIIYARILYGEDICCSPYFMS